MEGAAGGHYFNQPIDGSRIAIQGIGNGPMTTDAAASMISSPMAIPPTATVLTTPESAIEITFVTSTWAVQVCEVNASFNSYVQIPPATVFGPLDIANCGQLFVRSAVGTVATTGFFYTIV